MISSRALLLERIVAPGSEPVSLSDTKQFLRVEHSVDDALIGQLIITARQMAERYMRKSLITQSWKLKFNGVLESETRLAYGPVQSIIDVTVYDSLGSPTVLNSNSYALDATKQFVTTNNYFSADSVQIQYVAGYGVASDVPSPIRQGILIHVAVLYDQRDASGEIPAQAIALYRSYKEMGL